jgi:benzoylformate decarboxylase
LLYSSWVLTTHFLAETNRNNSTLGGGFSHIVPCNEEYANVKELAVLEKTPNVPVLDLPGLDIVSTAKGFGCIAVQVKTAEGIKEAFATALGAEGATVIAIPIARQLRPLVPSVAD